MKYHPTQHHDCTEQAGQRGTHRLFDSNSSRVPFKQDTLFCATATTPSSLGLHADKKSGA